MKGSGFSHLYSKKVERSDLTLFQKKKKKRHRRRVLLGNAACLMCVGEILISKEDLIRISRHIVEKQSLL